jgi:hypothetical protein
MDALSARLTDQERRHPERGGRAQKQANFHPKMEEYLYRVMVAGINAPGV